MTAFSQHIFFFPFSLEDKASRCKHETMHELSKSHLNRVPISMLGLVIYFFLTFQLRWEKNPNNHHCFPVCQNRQMAVLLISDCCQIPHCGFSWSLPHNALSPLPQLLDSAAGKSGDIWQGVDRRGINFITSLKLISNSINLLPMVKNPFWILRSSQQQYGMSSVS